MNSLNPARIADDVELLEAEDLLYEAEAVRLADIGAVRALEIALEDVEQALALARIDDRDRLLEKRERIRGVLRVRLAAQVRSAELCALLTRTIRMIGDRICRPYPGDEA